MATVLYFINDILFTTDRDKQKYRPSACWFCLKYLFLELFLMAVVGRYVIPGVLDDVAYFGQDLSKLIEILFIIIYIMFLIDLLSLIRSCIFGDLVQSLQFDFRWRDYKYGPDYSYYSELRAYGLYKKFDNSACTICFNEYKDEEIETDKQLLSCGHLYHKECLINYEKYKWNDDDWRYPICQCPLCKDRYHAHFEKFDFNKNYIEDLPFIYKSLEFPGSKLIESLFWKHFTSKYKQHSDKEWAVYQNRWDIDEYGC